MLNRTLIGLLALMVAASHATGHEPDCEDLTVYQPALSIFAMVSTANPPGTANVSLLVVKQSFTETCGEVASKDATCTHDYDVRIGAAAITGDGGNVQVALHENGTACPTWSLDSLASAIQIKTYDVTLDCASRTTKHYEVRPMSNLTNMEETSGGVTTYPLEYELVLTCNRCSQQPN